jgi:hypothetical protein
MRTGGSQGVNRYYYRRAAPATRTPDGSIDPRGFAGSTDDLGELVAVDTEVRPGGNRVEEFLDIVMDDASPGALVEAVRVVSEQISSVSFPVVHMSADVGLVFDMEYRLRPLARQQFVYLSNKALSWLVQAPPPLRESSPLVVRIRQVSTPLSMSSMAQALND